jgi:hypothetical protein
LQFVQRVEQSAWLGAKFFHDFGRVFQRKRAVVGGLYELQGGVLNARTSGTSISLQAIDGISSAELWAVGSAGTILRRNGSAWNTVQSGTVRELMRITPVGANDAWVAGWYGTLLRYQP